MTSQRTTRQVRTAPRRGAAARAFTLVEVILALAILAGAVAVLGEVMRIAGRNASEAQAASRAQLLATSLMDEILAGVVEPMAVADQPLETTDSTPWVYSVNFIATSYPDLAHMEVIVRQDLEPQFNPVSYKLVRWYSTLEDVAGSATATGTSTNSSGGY